MRPITGDDALDAYRLTLATAERESRAAQMKDRIRGLVPAEPPGERVVTKVLGRELRS